MRFIIRLLALGTLALFAVALWVGAQGEQADAIHAYWYAGMGEFFILCALVALTLLVFLLVATFGVVLAARQHDQAWGVAIALLVLGISALYLGSYLPPGVLLPVVRRVLPSSSFQALPLTLLPALLGSVVVAAYSFHRQSARRLPFD